jgi:FixJ family two-component response regulator
LEIAREGNETIMASHVYIVDDDDQFRESLCALIGSVGLQVEGWSDPGTFLKKESFERPGCVVLDYRLPSLSGLEVLRLLRQKSSVPTILISAYADVQTTVAAMEMGAATVFEKPIDDNSFLNRLERFCFEDQQWVLKRRSCEAVQKMIGKLTETERTVLDQLRLGLSNKAMARNLSKSIKAIERQRQNVVRKLDCNSAMEVTQKVQACPLRIVTPLTCPRDNGLACSAQAGCF